MTQQRQTHSQSHAVTGRSGDTGSAERVKDESAIALSGSRQGFTKQVLFELMLKNICIVLTYREDCRQPGEIIMHRQGGLPMFELERKAGIIFK